VVGLPTMNEYFGRTRCNSAISCSLVFLRYLPVVASSTVDNGGCLWGALSLSIIIVQLRHLSEGPEILLESSSLQKCAPTEEWSWKANYLNNIFYGWSRRWRIHFSEDVKIRVEIRLITKNRDTA
jgi:hypothetical protein